MDVWRGWVSGARDPRRAPNRVANRVATPVTTPVARRITAGQGMVMLLRSTGTACHKNVVSRDSCLRRIADAPQRFRPG